MKKRLLALLMCMLMLVGVLAGCGGGDNSSKADSSKADSSKEDVSKAESSKAGDASAPESQGDEGVTYPLVDTPIELSYYIKINGAMSATMETYADVEFFKFMEEKTNVKINWDHNCSNENFAMMITSGVLPDMINWNVQNAAGGVQALLEDEIIVDLTELMPKYAPAYYEWMQNNPEENKAFMLDDGTQFQFVNFNANVEEKKFVYFKIYGPQIRQDWLDKVGMKMPTTTDELYDVLVAFRDNDMNGNGDKTDEVPFAVGKGDGTLKGIAASFGTRMDMQNDPKNSGTIVYGPITENFKKFLTYMNKLYTEELINSDFAVNEEAGSLITQNKAGFTISSMGSSLIANHDNLKLMDESYNYVSVPWLIGPDGYQCNPDDKNANPRSTVITTSCKNVEVALRWLDYAYTDEGSLLSTFGIEGKSFEMVNGYPTILDSVKQNDKGWSEEQSIARWMLGPINYPNARDYRFYEQMNLNEQYKVDIQTNWNLATEDITLPPVIMTTEEAATYSSLMADIKTYMETSYQEFIIGEKSLDADWDAYVQTVKDMGIEQAIACKQAAYDRYMQK